MTALSNILKRRRAAQEQINSVFNPVYVPQKREAEFQIKQHQAFKIPGTRDESAFVADQQHDGDAKWFELTGMSSKR